MFCITSHKTRPPFALFLAFMTLSSGAYADTPADTGGTEKKFQKIANSPRDSLAYDQIIAQIPVAHAPIGSVALANLNIALHSAKQQAEITLCDGQWAPQGTVVFQQGPAIEQRFSRTDEIPAWHYVAFRYPLKLACNTNSRAAFFLEMSRHLPGWVQIRPAGQLSAFQQGESVPLEQETVAVK
jgi:hypothetical protein